MTSAVLYVYSLDKEYVLQLPSTLIITLEIEGQLTMCAKTVTHPGFQRYGIVGPWFLAQLSPVLIQSLSVYLASQVCKIWMVGLWVDGLLDGCKLWTVGPFDYYVEYQMDDYLTDSCAISPTAFFLKHGPYITDMCSIIVSYIYKITRT